MSSIENPGFINKLGIIIGTLEKVSNPPNIVPPNVKEVLEIGTMDILLNLKEAQSILKKKWANPLFGYYSELTWDVPFNDIPKLHKLLCFLHGNMDEIKELMEPFEEQVPKSVELIKEADEAFTFLCSEVRQFY